MIQRILVTRIITILALSIFLGFAWKIRNGTIGSSVIGVSATIPSDAKSFPADTASRGSATAESARASSNSKVGEFSGVLTYHNGNARTGANPYETILTPSNVNAGDFGKLFTVHLDGDVYAQPLYVPKVAVPSRGIHNTIYVGTENNTIYAIDADDPKGLILWSAHLGQALSSKDLPKGFCTVIAPVLGITGTPVIDASTHTLYVVARTFEHSRHEYQLHALDISTGAERPSSPEVISASLPGTGDGSRNGRIIFDPNEQLQRTGLALVAGKVHIGFGANCDYGNFHGWLLAYDASTLKQVAAIVTTPNASRGGIWESGAAPGADEEGNLFIVTGDGTFDAKSGGSDYGDTFLKLNLPADNRWKVLDYFTPFDQSRMEDLNDDLGSSGTVLLPNQPGPHPHLLVSGTKSGTIYVLDRDNMGHFRGENEAQTVQTLTGVLPMITSTAAYWEGTEGGWVYVNGVGGPLQQYSVNGGKLSSCPEFQSEELFGYPGSTPSVSSTGRANGIVWVVGTTVPDNRTVVRAYLHRFSVNIKNLVHEPRIFFRRLFVRFSGLFHSPSIFWGSLKKMLPKKTPEALDRPAILRAYDATNVSNLLYDSTEAPQDRDQADLPVKFVVPTIANGKVYFGTQGYLDVYGLLNK